MVAYAAVCAGPEDGHAAVWRRRFRGEKGHKDPQVPGEHSIFNRSLPLRHAGGPRRRLKEIVWTFWQISLLLSGDKLDEKIYTTLTSVR